MVRALVALGGLVLLGACQKQAPPPPKRLPPLVVVTPVTTRDVPVEIRAPIDLRPLAQADVGAKTLGYLDAVLVDRGDAVKRGQLVALVRPSDLPDQLAAARGTLAQTHAQVAQARANLDRIKQLAPSGIVSQQDLQNAETALTTAKALEDAAQAQVGALGVRLGETRIESPLDGVVTLRRLDPGALVGPQGSGAILTIAKIDVLRAFVSVAERDLVAIKVGMDAEIDLDALPGKKIAAKVVRIAPTVDPATRTVDAEVQVPNPDGVLRPGMFGHGALLVDVHKGAVTVPAQAVLTSNREHWVFVVNGNQVARKRITTGVDGGDWLEVLSGLDRSDEVVSAGTDALADGVEVRTSKNIDPYSGAPAVWKQEK
jgi:membrane fusion protein (multidrug efflux system)/multidrug efflux system membrane fusion protein